MRRAQILTVLLAATVCIAQDQKTHAKNPSTNPYGGATIYQHYCAACHGADARGHGPSAISLKLTAPDLTLISQHNSGKFPYQRTRETIEGKKSEHGTSMPGWGPVFHEVEADQDWGEVKLDAITRYIESIQQK